MILWGFHKVQKLFYKSLLHSKIIKIALSNNNAGLKNKFTHKSSVKNSLCGDEIKINLIIKEDKVIDFGYEGKSCIYCQASASLLSQISINKKKSKIKE